MARQYQTTIFDDSTVESAMYDWADNKLVVVFENTIRTYDNVSEDDYESFSIAESQTTSLSVLGNEFTEVPKTNQVPTDNTDA